MLPGLLRFHEKLVLSFTQPEKAFRIYGLFSVAAYSWRHQRFMQH
jgi:hypothetical protein